jgi:8-oxo-dGTP diphosphatase
VAPVVCGACGAEHWRNAKPCAGALVTRDGKLLLVRRAIPPWLGYWDIPGGFCDGDEHPEQAAVREAYEEVGLEVAINGLLGIWMDSYGPADADGAVDTTMNCYYMATPLTDALPVVDPHEASEAAWFAPDALPEDISFPEHARQVLAAWRTAVASGTA